MPTRLSRCHRIAAIVHVVVISSALAGDSWAATDQEAAHIPRVRSDNPVIAAAIAHGTRQSTTFLGLIDAIDATDGLVYVEQGECGSGVRACLLLSIQISGPYRVLRILVNPTRAPRCELTPSIGHELQHALEALSHRGVRSDGALINLFDRIGVHNFGRFETQAAQRTDAAVRKEACRR